MGAVCSHPNLDPSFSAPQLWLQGSQMEEHAGCGGNPDPPNAQLSSVRKIPARLPSPLQTRRVALQAATRRPSSCGPDSALITGPAAVGGQQAPQPGASR